jgi:hypothetical protein
MDPGPPFAIRGEWDRPDSVALPERNPPQDGVKTAFSGAQTSRGQYYYSAGKSEKLYLFMGRADKKHALVFGGMAPVLPF